MSELLLYFLLFLNVLQITRCRQVISNELLYSQSKERLANDEDNFNAPVIVDVMLDNEGEGDVYEYRNIPKNISRGSPEDMRRCSGSSCGGRYIRKRPASKDYPTNMHCRGVLVYCKKECVALTTRICGEWDYMCPGNIKKEIPQRCTTQCIHNFRQMRLKFPVMAKLSKFTNPRYDRFDYE